MVTEFKKQDVASLTYRKELQAMQARLAEAPDAVAVTQTCTKLAQWLDALKPQFTEGLLGSLEAASSFVLELLRSKVSVESLRNMSAEERQALTTEMEKFSSDIEGASTITRGRRSELVVLKSKAKETQQQLLISMSVVQAVEVMEPLSKMLDKPKELACAASLHQPLLDYLNSNSGDVLPGSEAPAVQQAMAECWSALVTSILDWAGDPQAMIDSERIMFLVSAAKRLHRGISKHGQDSVMESMDCAAQLRSRMCSSSPEVFVAQEVNVAKSELMHLVALLKQGEVAVKAAEAAELQDEDAMDFRDKMCQLAQNAFTDAGVFLGKSKTLMADNANEKLRALRLRGEKLVATAPRGVWQLKQGRHGEELSFAEVKSLAEKSLLKGKYAQQVDELVKSIDQETGIKRESKNRATSEKCPSLASCLCNLWLF